MIKLDTVLILGAGASWYYNFPTGTELVSKICEDIGNSESKQFHLLDEIVAGNNQPSPSELHEVITKAKPLSIDAWLEHNPKFLEVGKIAIAMRLLEYERKAKLRDERFDWYQLLFQRLNCPFEEFHNNRLSIITFNYDRSLEHFLFRIFRHTHTERSEPECIKKFNQFKILHVYGSLGRLEWQSDDPDNPVPQVRFGSSLDKDSIISAASCIKIISEQGEELSQEFQQAKELIMNAKALYFLGFGYHELNMRRLGVEKLERRPGKVMGTIYGLDYQRIREIERLHIRGDFSVRHGGLVHEPVYEFLYDYIDFNEGGLPDKNIKYK